MLLENNFVLFCWVVVVVVLGSLDKIFELVHKFLGKKQPIRHTLEVNPMRTY